MAKREKRKREEDPAEQRPSTGTSTVRAIPKLNHWVVKCGLAQVLHILGVCNWLLVFMRTGLVHPSRYFRA